MRHRIPSLIAAALVTVAAAAQTQVSVMPVITPPYSTHLSDYQGALIVNITNTTNEQVALKLIGTLTGDNGFSGHTRSTYAPPAPVVLGPLETRVLQANSQAMDFIDRNNFEVSAPQQVQNAVIQTGILPEGNYELCVQAVDYQTGEPLSAEAPVGCLFFPITYAQPPVLTFPWCDGTVGDPWPVFTWSPPVGAINMANVRYDLYVLEVLPGQNPANAMMLAMDGVAGNPMVRTDLMVPSYPWQSYDPTLKENTLYAVGVMARDVTESVLFENRGRSEVCTFTIQPPTATSGTGVSVPDLGIGTYVPAITLPLGPLPDTHVKGRLLYRFKESTRPGCDPAGPLSIANIGGVILSPNAVVGLAGVPPPAGGAPGGGTNTAMAGPLINAMGAGAAGGTLSMGPFMGAFNQSGGSSSYSYGMGESLIAPVGMELISLFPQDKWKDPFPVSTTGAKPLKNIPIKLVEHVVLTGVTVYHGKGQQTQYDRLILGVDSMPFMDGVLTGQQGDAVEWHYGKVVATGTTDGNGNFDLFYHQPSYTGISLGSSSAGINSLIIDPISQEPLMLGSIDAYNSSKVLMIEVASPYYCSPDLEIYAQPGDVVELPEQACYVRSYDLKVSVRQGNCAMQMGGTGSPMGNVQVSVMRPADHTPTEIPDDEGQHLDQSMPMPGLGDVPLVARCATKTGDGSALFHNMVVHSDAAPDDYLLDCRTSTERGLYHYLSWNKAWPNSYGKPPVVLHGARSPLNSQLGDIPVYEVSVDLVPLQPRVMGRVMVSATEPLPNALVTLRLAYDPAPGNVSPVIVGCEQNTGTADFTYMEYTRLTDPDGFFDFTGILVKGSSDGMFFLGPHASILVSKPGYWPAIRPLAGEPPGVPPGQVNNSNPASPKVDLKMGLQWDMTSGILMKPVGWVKGLIQDEEGRPVRCDVQVGDGPWGRSEMMMEVVGTTGGQAPPSGNTNAPLIQMGDPIIPWSFQVPGAGGGQNVQPVLPPGQTQAQAPLPGAGGFMTFKATEQFMVHGPSGMQQVQLVPLSDQYFPLTVTRNVPFPVGDQPVDLGAFTVKEKRHRLRVKLDSFGGPVAGAVVRVDDRQQVSDSDGIAYFEFLSAASEFRLRVQPGGDLIPVDRIIVNDVSPEPVTLEQFLDNGTQLVGHVVSAPGNAPVPGARVWVEIGSDQYGPQLNQTTTDANGNFTLSGVPMGPFTVHAAKSDPQVSYIGTAQDVTYVMVPGPPPNFGMVPKMPVVTLVLQRVDDLDLTTLLGFPVEVTGRTKNNDGSSTINGAFVNLPANPNFRLYDPAQRILFSAITVDPGPPGPGGKPRAVPRDGKVVTDMAQVPIGLYTDLRASLKGLPFSFFPGRVEVHAIPNGGEVRGTVGSELSSFNFSYDFTGSFYLGDGAEQPLITVFRNGAPLPQRSYNLMTLAYGGGLFGTWSPSNAQFSLRGFPARSDRTRSVVEPDVFRIATVIQVKDVPDITPAVLDLDVGEIRVNATTIEGIQGGGSTLNFKLNDWSFSATSPWTFNNELAAIVIPSGVLDMKLAKADMSQVMIRPNALEMAAKNLGEVRLGGVAPLQPAPGTTWTFGYDPGYLFQGKAGAWRFGALTAGSTSVASIKGPPELVPGQVELSSFSLFSRGMPLAEVRARNYRYHDIVDLVPVGAMQFTPDGVDLLANCSLAIHGLPQTTGFFSFYKENGQPASRLKPLGATITTGRGNVYFQLDDRMASQEIGPGHFTCYGRFRIDPGAGETGAPVYAYGFLDHKAGNTFIDLIREDGQHYKGSTRQAIAFGGDKMMLLNSGRQTMGSSQWEELSFKGNLVNMEGIADAPENELSFTVKGAVSLQDGKIGMDQLATPFGNMAMSYDFEHARLVGSLGLHNNMFGAVNIVDAQLGLLVDKGGFLVSCYDAHVIVPPVPWPLNDHHPAFLIGSHNSIPDTLLSNMMAGFRLKSLPAHMAGKQIKGLYLQDKLSLVDIPVPSVDLLLLGVEGHAGCAVEGRNWVDLSGSIGFGGMAYADASLNFWLLSPIPNCSSMDLSTGASALFEASLQNGSFGLDACGSTSASASICGVGDSYTFTVKAGVNAGGFYLHRTDGPCGQ
ncbi:MAG: carboxypeptidase regulatory-like domain-containing protein [Flavobacteriales bacterium]|nr:carboxypeptidase regulatory-like domain-containing protein [Flavobacteriales bacterium]MEB2341492.1 carboxypeptidase regulatory-like domain-containing protein [Flavobacteriia bacterium]